MIEPCDRPIMFELTQTADLSRWQDAANSNTRPMSVEDRRRVPNPFVYGRVLGGQDAACPRPAYETAILDSIRNRGRLALAGDRRLGKSTLIERTHQTHGHAFLRWDFQSVLSVDDLVRRAAEDLESFIRSLSLLARRITPWLREAGIGVENIRLSYHGVQASIRTTIPTDHLKRLLGYVSEIAKRRAFSLFIDEIQDARDFLAQREGDAVLGVLRSELQRIPIPCFYAGSARESFRGLFVSDVSPFFESARLIELDPIRIDDFSAFICAQFEKGRFEISVEAVNVLLGIGGDSPNDVQHLAHETWNFALRKAIGAPEIGRALEKILSDHTALGEAWLSQLTKRQRRVLLAIAFYEHLGYATEEFLAAAGARSGASVISALRPCVQGRQPILEKVGSRYRVRSRYLRIWLVMQRHLAQELIPPLREERMYHDAVRRVCPPLAIDLIQR